MIFGSIFLYLMLYFLLPNGKEILNPLYAGIASLPDLFEATKNVIFNLFSLENLRAWNFWLFIYISFCIASHLAPSAADRRGMWNGLAWLVLILIFVNAVALLLGVNITDYILSINQYLSILVAIFVYSLLISFIHYILVSIILLPFRK